MKSMNAGDFSEVRIKREKNMENQEVNQNLNQDLNQDQWDYSLQAPYYEYRPNYEPSAVDQMLRIAGFNGQISFQIADVGAGTGNFTLMLESSGAKVIAIEPNESMRRIGEQRVHGDWVDWKVATGEKTELSKKSIDLFVMGSSFNTTRRQNTLNEVNRVLKPGGWFSCLWNHRELESDPIQAQSEKIIREFYPKYTHGSRREDQTPLLQKQPFFDRHEYFEKKQWVRQDREKYLLAWRSVRNQHWDLRLSEEKSRFNEMCKRMRSELPKELNLTYITRVWMSRKANVQ